MTSPEEIIKIADTRLEEAKLLFKEKRYSGAFYLAGYSVELTLKAKICQSFGTPNLFDEKNSTKGIDKVRSSVKTHDLTILLIFSGLKPKYDGLKNTNPKMLKNISFLMKKWNEAERYKPDSPVRYAQIEKTINNLEDFLKWIKTN